MSQPSLPSPRRRRHPRSRFTINWSTIVILAAAAYIAAVAVSRPDFLIGFRPILKEEEKRAAPPPEDWTKNPEVLKTLRSMREKGLLHTGAPGDQGTEMNAPGASSEARH
jgi:hypothetical protein